MVSFRTVMARDLIERYVSVALKTYTRDDDNDIRVYCRAFDKADKEEHT